MKKIAYIIFLILFLSASQNVLAISCSSCEQACHDIYYLNNDDSEANCVATECKDCEQTGTDEATAPVPTVTPESTETPPPPGYTGDDTEPAEDNTPGLPSPAPQQPTTPATTVPKPTVGETIADAIAITDVEFTPNVPFGDFQKCTFSGQGGGTGGNNCLGKYINAWYGFALGTVGILATFMIMFAGFKYMTDPKSAGDAKKIIVSAVSGLILMFLIYTILNIVNPNLLVISMPSIPRLDVKAGMDLSAQEATKMGYSDLPSSVKGSNPRAITDLGSGDFSPRQEGETNAQALARNAAAANGLGIGNSAATGGGTVGCALAVDRLVHETYNIPGGQYNLSVSGLYDEFSNSGNFQEVTITSADQLQPGDVIMSIDAPKPDGGTRSHTGVVIDNGNILSNSSGNRSFSWETDYNGWNEYYPNNNNTTHVLRPI